MCIEKLELVGNAVYSLLLVDITQKKNKNKPRFWNCKIIMSNWERYMNLKEILVRYWWMAYNLAVWAKEEIRRIRLLRRNRWIGSTSRFMETISEAYSGAIRTWICKQKSVMTLKEFLKMVFEDVWGVYNSWSQFFRVQPLLFDICSAASNEQKCTKKQINRISSLRKLGITIGVVLY